MADLIWLGIGPSTTYPQRFLTFGLRPKRLAELTGAGVTAAMGRFTTSAGSMTTQTMTSATMGRTTTTTGGS